jgi:hypothetical protein
MRTDRLVTVWVAMLYACFMVSAQTAHAQPKSAAPQITVYESPT